MVISVRLPANIHVHVVTQYPFETASWNFIGICIRAWRRVTNGCLLFLVFKFSVLIFSSPEPKAPGYRQGPFSTGSRSVVGNASNS